MNRRGFLQLLAGAGAATATSYFFAPIGGWKSDVIVNPTLQHFNARPLGIWDDPRNLQLAAKSMVLYGLRYYQTVPSDMEWIGIKRDVYIGKRMTTEIKLRYRGPVRLVS